MHEEISFSIYLSVEKHCEGVIFKLHDRYIDCRLQVLNKYESIYGATENLPFRPLKFIQFLSIVRYFTALKQSRKKH